VALDDAAVGSAAELAGRVRSRQAAAALRIDLRRDGWRRSVTLSPALPTQVRVAPTSPASLPAAVATGDSPDARPDGLRAAVTVGDFQVKAAKATPYIGDGLREMLLTALHRSGYFIVVERMDIQGIAAEQALSRSTMARPDQAIPAAGMDVADLLIYGAVTEFEAEAGGSDFGLGAGGSTPFSFGAGGKQSHMAIDIRVADVRSGRLVLAKRFVGRADASRASLGVSPLVGGRNVPFSFGGFRNTPMERAIRDCVVQATQYVANNLPRDYFRHH